MGSMFSYSKAAMERAMKVQEVIWRAMAKKITWWQAAEILGISDRHMRRWREGYQEFGYDGLFDRRRGKPSPKRVPLAVVEQVLGLYRDRYADLNVRHFHEKLSDQHQIELSYSWVKQALQGAGLVARGRKRGVHRKRRPRRPLPGMLLVTEGRVHESRVARTLRFDPGTIVVFDRGYTDYAWFSALDGVYFVTRIKDNADYGVLERRPVPERGPVQRDEIIFLYKLARRAEPDLYPAPHRGLGRSARPHSGLPHESSPLCRLHHRRHLPSALADRTVLQSAQAEPPHQDFRRHQRQRSADSGLDRADCPASAQVPATARPASAGACPISPPCCASSCSSTATCSPGSNSPFSPRLNSTPSPSRSRFHGNPTWAAEWQPQPGTELRSTRNAPLFFSPTLPSRLIYPEPEGLITCSFGQLGTPDFGNIGGKVATVCISKSRDLG